MKSIKAVLSAAILWALTSCSPSGGDLDTLVKAWKWDDAVSCGLAHSDALMYRDVFQLNMALAQTGSLADRAFELPQAGSSGLIPEWDRSREAGEWLSDIYFAMGHIALSQRMAFEAAVCSDSFNAGMYRRLVQTNIIYGEYPVAEMYISALEKDGTYAKWAREQRRFLYDDAAVEADSLYALKRACIPPKDFMAEYRGIDEDMKDIIRCNPLHRSTIEYLGLYYLLDFDFERFRGMLDEFYGTQALPELPKSFAEAVCMMSETDHGYWKTMGVSRDEYDSYRDFKKRFGAGLDISRYKDTFWYYIMKANTADES